MIECLKLALRLRKYHGLARVARHRLLRALLPMSTTSYRRLQREDAFPDPFWRNKTRIGLISSVAGLSLATHTVSPRVPLNSDGMKMILRDAATPVRLQEAVDNQPEGASADEERRGRPSPYTYAISDTGTVP